MAMPDFSVIYASAKNGWAVNEVDQIDNVDKDMTPLLQEILKKVPAPVCDDESSVFALAVTMIRSVHQSRCK